MAVVILGATTTRANASPLLPGDTAAPSVFFIGYDGTLLLEKEVTFDTGTVQGSAIGMAIWLDNAYCSHCLDILLQLSNPGSVPLVSFELTGYARYQTSVGYDARSVGSSQECGPRDEGFCDAYSIPTTVYRSSGGDVIGFTFSDLFEQSSVVAVIETDAQSVADPTLTIFAADGSQATLGALGPFGPPAGSVPEPSTLMLFGTGILGLARAGRRRVSSHFRSE